MSRRQSDAKEAKKSTVVYNESGVAFPGATRIHPISMAYAPRSWHCGTECLAWDGE